MHEVKKNRLTVFAGSDSLKSKPVFWLCWSGWTCQNAE
jgi:hypothetical protein